MMFFFFGTRYGVCLICSKMMNFIEVEFLLLFDFSKSSNILISEWVEKANHIRNGTSNVSDWPKEQLFYSFSRTGIINDFIFFFFFSQ